MPVGIPQVAEFMVRAIHVREAPQLSLGSSAASQETN